MKIENLNIHNSTVTIAEKIINNANYQSWGLDEMQFSKLTSIIKNNEKELSEEVNLKFDIRDTQFLSVEKKNKFTDILKKFGYDFASHLTSIGVIDLIKHFIIPTV